MFSGFIITAALNPGFPGRSAPRELPLPGLWHSFRVYWRGWALRWWAYMHRSMQHHTVPQKQSFWPADKHLDSKGALWLHILEQRVEFRDPQTCPSDEGEESNKEQVPHLAVPGGQSWRAQADDLGDAKIGPKILTQTVFKKGFWQQEWTFWPCPGRILGRSSSPHRRWISVISHSFKTDLNPREHFHLCQEEHSKKD